MPLFNIPILVQVSLVHLVSHVYIMTVPGLLPLLPDVVGVGYVELGFALGVFSILTTLVQLPMGFATDRYGARRMLAVGMTAGSLGILLFAALPCYASLLLMSALAGTANGIYHPADYTILSRTTRQANTGRHFSIHSFAGYLGTAATPAILTGIALFSSVRTALAVSGLFGLTVMVMFLLSRPSTRESRRPANDGGAVSRVDRKVFTVPIVVLIAVFLLLSMSLASLEKFSVSAFIHEGFGIDLTLANTALTAFLFCSAFGVLGGGILADKTRRHGFVASAAFALAAILLAAVIFLPLPGVILVSIWAVVGFLSGVIVPSRDMLVRAVAPSGAEGKVYGVVFSGYSLGSAVSPVLCGYLLDNGMPRLVFGLAMGFMILTVAATWTQDVMVARRRQ